MPGVFHGRHAGLYNRVWFLGGACCDMQASLAAAAKAAHKAREGVEKQLKQCTAGLPLSCLAPISAVVPQIRILRSGTAAGGSRAPPPVFRWAWAPCLPAVYY